MERVIHVHPRARAFVCVGVCVSACAYVRVCVASILHLVFRNEGDGFVMGIEPIRDDRATDAEKKSRPSTSHLRLTEF